MLGEEYQIKNDRKRSKSQLGFVVSNTRKILHIRAIENQLQCQRKRNKAKTYVSDNIYSSVHYIDVKYLFAYL